MKNLLYKEWKLSSHPTTYLFLSFGLMLLIPNYPSYVAGMYLCLSIFFLFLGARENKDVFYTVMLPIRKRDAVKARCLWIGLIQVLQLLLSAPFAVLHGALYGASGNPAGIEPNLAFYGFAFGMFAVFNFVFIPGFYKTAYRIGRPLILGGAAVAVYYAAVEALVWIPGPAAAFLDTMDPARALSHLPILAAGAALWAAALYAAFRRGAARFEKVDV